MLALSLTKSASPEDGELREAKAAGINPNRYFNEVYFLCGFAVFRVLAVALVNSPKGEAARDGFMGVFQDRAKANPTEAGLLRIFRERMAAYHEVSKNLEPGTLDPITLKFGSFELSVDSILSG